jgi:type IX secretion system PorP/SprF family membrane protein
MFMMCRLVMLTMILVGAGICKEVVAQQIPLYSQYLYNRLLYNPAETGTGDRTVAHFIYRKQWQNFQGGPETRLLSVNGGFPNKRLGLGGYIFSDYTGEVVKRIGGKLTYAYHLPLGDEQTLSLGIGAGVVDHSIDREKVRIEDPTDEVITGQLDVGTAVDATVGLRYRWKGLKLGASVPQVVESDLRYVNNREDANYQLARHYTGYGSYEFQFGSDDNWGLEPLVMMRTTEDFQYQLDGNLIATYDDFVWLSAGYRWDYAATFAAGVKVHDLIKVGYSYDLAVNELKGFSGGSHEVMLGVVFGGGQKQEDEDKKFKELNERLDTISKRNDSLRGSLKESKDSLMDTKMELAQKTAEIDSLKKDIGNFEKSRKEEGKDVQDAKRTLTVDRENLSFVTGDIKKNYYLVVSSNRVEKWARMYHKKLQKQGYESGVVYNKKRDWYYVFITKVQDMEGGLQELYKLREQNKFKDAWIHIIK